ncbi:uncharacterized protein [Typha latifolia]|uniref:uncharacterized protein n=1 Tax=Typha latifolia TaxID=4733 RepID=UPI003C2B2D8C
MWIALRRAIRPFHGSQRQGAIALVSCVVILITTLVLIRGRPSSPSELPSTLKWNSFENSTQFQPSLQSMNGTDVIWQIPTSPKAVLFIAHGCNVRATNFWDKSSNCPSCDGLPEERIFVLQALERKFAVLTISSLGKCWSFEREMENVEWIIKWWIRKYKLGGLPVVALGASSGGYFVSALAAKMRFSSITIMIAEGVFNDMGVPKGYPPTLFVHMQKDRIRMSLVGTNMKALKNEGVEVKEIKCMEFPLTPTYLCDRIPGLGQNFAVKFLEIFRHKGFVDDKGYMKSDGRHTPWKNALKEKNLLSEKYGWINHVEEELNLAYGYHEFSSLQSDDIFEWFESHMK